MKNTVKFLSMMFAAGAMMFASCTPEPEPEPEPEVTKYTVQVNCNDATMGTVTIAPQQATYLEGDTVVITATPNDGYKFLNWNGSITDNPYTYVVKENITFTANFEALPLPSYSVTFEGTALDVAGYGHGWYLQNNGDNWIFEAASHIEGNRVSFPYLVLWMTGSNPNALTVSSSTELYKDTYYESGENQYGDWQFKSVDNMNCTELDLTALKLSMTTSVTMYYLTDMVENGAQTPEECTTATLAATITNFVFEPYGKAAFKKMNIKK